MPEGLVASELLEMNPKLYARLDFSSAKALFSWRARVSALRHTSLDVLQQTLRWLQDYLKCTSMLDGAHSWHTGLHHQGLRLESVEICCCYATARNAGGNIARIWHASLANDGLNLNWSWEEKAKTVS